MSDQFNTIVHEIVNQYINNVLFVDEQAFTTIIKKDSPDKQKSLDAAAVSRAFSESKKICGFYAPETLEDIERCKQLVLIPDIVVLDWDIRINVAISKEEENQDDDTDDRGRYSIELLKSIIQDAGNEKLKVVFVYTGEPGINVVMDNISEAIGKEFRKNEADFEIFSDNIHVLIRIKPNSKVEHTGYEHFQVAYSDLPQVLIKTFSNYVSGLMPCFAMSSLTALRACTARILRIYNSELDAELLGHQLALDNPNDAKSYLANSFGSAVSELIMDNKSTDTDQWVEGWIDSCFSPEGQSISFVGTHINRSAISLKDFFFKRMTPTSLKERINTSFSSSLSARSDTLKQSLSVLFHKEGEDVLRAKFNFAALSHHKNVFANHSSAPILTLGTIIKDKEGNCFLCIQQRCDTLRLPIKGMDFVFLPLVTEKSEMKVFEAVAIGPGDIRYIVQSSSSALLINFSPDKEHGPVVARTVGGKYIFKSSQNEFEWVNELKDIVAQRVVTAYVSHFARVGVDVAEWLRIEGTNKK